MQISLLLISPNFKACKKFQYSFTVIYNAFQIVHHESFFFNEPHDVKLKIYIKKKLNMEQTLGKC